MISYAQNFEDVILSRALCEVGTGFFVDIGAAHPVDDSVTCHFYELGWSGINVEPDPMLFSQLQTERARDVNLSCVVGNPSMLGEVTTLNVVSNPGLTTLDDTAARGYREQGLEISQTTAKVVRLDEILLEHACDRDIHFLKIDVEGSEIGVIDTNDWERFRPWIVVVEAVVSNTGSQISTTGTPGDGQAGEIEHAMTSHRYRLAYFDGLNHFYVAAEHSALSERLAVPPNVFDNFIRLREARCSEERASFQAQAEDAEQRLIDFSRNAHAEFDRLKAESEKSSREMREWSASLEDQIHEMTSSWRWKATHPRIHRKSD